MSAYCDTSFVLRQLVPGQHRAGALEIAATLEDRFGFVPITKFTRFEVVQALRFEAWRNQNDRTRGLPLTHVEAALSLFLAEIGSSFRLTAVDFDTVIAHAELFTQTTSEKGWRTIDLMHVASATSLHATEFYSFDEQQNRLASLQNLKTPLAGRAIL